MPFGKLLPGRKITVNKDSSAFFVLLTLTAVFFAWLAVAPCLHNDFTNWDEKDYIVNNPKIKSLTPASVKAIFSSRDLKMYSPLSTLSYALNYHFSGLKPKAYHATAIALHLLNTALAMFFVRLILPGIWPAFFCGLFFGIHPAHIESVAWAAERKDLLYSVFYLLSLCAYIFSLRGKKTYLAALGLFTCALLSKPMAVTLPLALILIDYLKLEKVGRKDWLNKIPFFVGAAVFSAATRELAVTEQWAPVAHRLCVVFYNIGFYLYTLAWPFNLSAMYVTPLGGPKFIYVLAVATVAAAGLFWKYCRHEKEIMFGAGFYVAQLLPVLQFFPFGPVLSADRYTYLPSLGLFISVSTASAGAWARGNALKRNTIALLIIAAAITFTVAARVRCADWKNSISLWSDTLRKQPAAPAALFNLCAEYLDTGLEARAAACLSEAIRKHPGNDNNYYNLGLLLYRNEEYATAGKYLGRALKLNPRHSKAFFILGNIALMENNDALAQQFYLRSVASDALYAPPLHMLGGLAAKGNNRHKAVEYYKRALALEPANAETIEALSAMLRQK